MKQILDIYKGQWDIKQAVTEQGCEEVAYTDGAHSNNWKIAKVNETDAYGEPVENVHIYINDGVSEIQDILLTPAVIEAIKELTN